ncbi:MAG: acyl carrier protein [Chromatiales bacterium]
MTEQEGRRGQGEKGTKGQGKSSSILAPSPHSPFPSYTAESIETWLARWVSDELKIVLTSIDRRKSLFFYGLDSVTAIGLSSDLEVWLGRQLPPALAWNYPTIETLAQHLAQESEYKDSQVNVIDKINQGKAQESLANLDNLSDEEVDSLLSQMLAPEEGNS